MVAAAKFFCTSRLLLNLAPSFAAPHGTCALFFFSISLSAHKHQTTMQQTPQELFSKMGNPYYDAKFEGDADDMIHILQYVPNRTLSQLRSHLCTLKGVSPRQPCELSYDRGFHGKPRSVPIPCDDSLRIFFDIHENRPTPCLKVAFPATTTLRNSSSTTNSTPSSEDKDAQPPPSKSPRTSGSKSSQGKDSTSYLAMLGTRGPSSSTQQEKQFPFTDMVGSFHSGEGHCEFTLVSTPNINVPAGRLRIFDLVLLPFIRSPAVRAHLSGYIVVCPWDARIVLRDTLSVLRSAGVDEVPQFADVLSSAR
jgi:hypothetical protein